MYTKAVDIELIRQWVARGEDERLEFKLKANHPEKIIREIVALANTKGGHLIVGVSDDRKIVGLKYPDEAHFQISRALQKCCRPGIRLSSLMIPAAGNRRLLVYQIPKSGSRPHFIESSSGERKAYFRIGEHSIQASPELCTILEQSNSTESISFVYGEAEHALMQLLDSEGSVTVESFSYKARISRKKAADVLVLMVLAKVIRIHPSDAGDQFTMIPISSSVASGTYIY